MARQIIIEPVTRIEGHAKISIDIDDGGEIVDGRLHVLEIRGFEKFVQGMELRKMPLITARICGVCPAAHHLAAVAAIENGCSVTVPQAAKNLRELMYMGHIIHSHALSCFVFLGPDVLSGVGAPPDERNIFHLLSKQPDLAKQALRLRSIGQKIVEIVGGRGVHPVTAIPGGMAARPTDDDMNNMKQWGNEAAGILNELRPKMLEVLKKLDSLRATTVIDAFPVALSKNGVFDYLLGECRVLDEKGGVERSFSAGQYGEHLIEKVMPGSYMKTVRLKGTTEKHFFVGPLARLMVNASFPTPKASVMLQEFKRAALPRPSILDFIDARLIEMVFCSERIVEIASQPIGKEKLCVEVTPHEGRFVGMVEAPRGLLIHDYTADKDGQVITANLIVATQNNYDAINASITSIARHFLPLKDDNQFMNGAEFAVRCFDPCLSCATHIGGRTPMVVEISSHGEIIRTITRSAT